MSIIQEALEKAQSDVKPTLPPSGSIQTERAAGPKLSVAPVVKKPREARVFGKKELTTAVFFVLTAIVILFIGSVLLMSGDKGKRTSAKNAQEVNYRPIVRDASKDPANTDERLKMSPEFIRKAGAPELILNGIMYVEGKPRAIINNLIVETGDSLLGAFVTEIKRESVILEYENVEITLNLK